MSDTVLHMPKKPKGKDAGKATRYPSRDKIKYAGLPREYWELLDAMTVDGAKYEGRSVSFLTKLAVRAFLQAEGRLDAKGKPVTKAEGG